MIPFSLDFSLYQLITYKYPPTMNGSIQNDKLPAKHATAAAAVPAESNQSPGEAARKMVGS